MKKLLLLLFLIPNLVMAEEKFIPVAEYTANKAHWQSNLYEILYVACRCGFAYSSAHHQLVEHIGEDEVKEDLHKKGFDIAMKAADHIENTFGGDISQFDYSSLELTIEGIADFYEGEAKKSYIGNKQFNGIMGNDLKACESYDAFFEGLLREAV